MEYCRNQGINPAFHWAWNKAEKAYTIKEFQGDTDEDNFEYTNPNN